MDKTFINETIVNLSRHDTVALYTDIGNFSKWQKNFISHQLISDESGMEVAEVSYNIAGKTLSFVRKVLKSDLPSMMVATFEIEGVQQIVVTKFVIISENKCKIESIVTLSSAPSKLNVKFHLVAAAFKAQTKYMQSNFKKFAEHQAAFEQPFKVAG